MSTPVLGMIEWAGAQASPWFVHNVANRTLEQGAGWFRFIDRDLTAPPGSPAEGDCYLVAGSATGAWSGHDGEIAFLMGGGWVFIEPLEGTGAGVLDENVAIAFLGGSWTELATASGSSLEVEDEGASEATSVTKLNFVGAGVTATDQGGGEVEIDIPGGGGGGGLLALSVTSDGTPASTALTDLKSYTLPGGTLSADGMGIRVRAAGVLTSTTRTRNIRIYFGSTAYFEVGSGNASATSWQVDLTIRRSGASEVRWMVRNNMGSGSATDIVDQTRVTTTSPDLSVDQVVKVTGQVSGTPVANDITCILWEVELLSA